MKTLSKFNLIAILSVAISVSLSFSAANGQGYVSFETFYHELSPYGQWVHNPQHGQVWIPSVRQGFRPYLTGGHWVMTDYGNTWVSDYNWGWAPFHYGRWYLDDYYGWAWVPGYEWGPAWVAWRSGGGHYGWAPLYPGLNVNVSINIGRRIPSHYWAFVPHRYISSRRIYDFCLPRRRVANVYRHTTIINNTYVYNDQHHYYSGPQAREIQRVTNRPVRVHRVQTVSRPRATAVRNGSVAIYQPGTRGSRGSLGRATPVTRQSARDDYRGNVRKESTYERGTRSSTVRTQPAQSSRRNINYANTSRSNSSRSSMSRSSSNTGAVQRSSSTRSNSSSTRSSQPASQIKRSSNERHSGSVQKSRSSSPRSSVTRSSSSSKKAQSGIRSRSSSTTSRSSSRSSVNRSRTSQSRTTVTRSSTSKGSNSRVKPRSSTTRSNTTRNAGSRSGVTRSGVTRNSSSRSSKNRPN